MWMAIKASDGCFLPQLQAEAAPSCKLKSSGETHSAMPALYPLTYPFTYIKSVLPMRTNCSSYLDRRKHNFEVSISIFSFLYPNIVFASFIYQDYQNSFKDANLSKTYPENVT